MPDPNKSRPPHGGGGNTIIYNNCAFINGPNHQDNSVSQVVNANTHQPNAPRRRSLQWVRHALALMIRLLPIAAGSMAYLLTNSGLPFV